MYCGVTGFVCSTVVLLGTQLGLADLRRSVVLHLDHVSEHSVRDDIVLFSTDTRLVCQDALHDRTDHGHPVHREQYRGSNLVAYERDAVFRNLVLYGAECRKKMNTHKSTFSPAEDFRPRQMLVDW